jgi:hypothetical protein
MKQKETKRKKLEVLKAQLTNERSSFIPTWRDVGEHTLVRRARFFVSDVNKGDRRSNKIIDSTATMALRTLRSGLMSGITSPARPWFRLTTPDPSMMEMGAVKNWLHTVAQRMSTTFLRSNLYNILPIVYGDLGAFGTAAMMIEEDFDEVLRCYSFPIGSYMIAKDYRGRVNTFFREYRMTVRQIVEEFADKLPNGEPDFSNISLHVKSAYERGETETWIDVCHVIKPNDDYNPDKIGSKFKKYYSCTYEANTSQGKSHHTGADEEKYLRESGYDLFPVLVPRWEVTGEDVYGTSSPGIEALGDIKQLQLGEKRGAQAIEKMVNPPMVASPSLRNQKASIVAGDITYLDGREAGDGGFRPAHEVNIRIAELEQKQQQIRERIKEAFYANLFLMLANSDRRDFTAREIDERHEEKLLALGPVLEQLNQDLLDPLIDIAFDIHLRQELLPPPPDEIAGMQIKVEYISVMAQAQKLAHLGGVERFVQFAGQLAGFDPNVLKKINTEQLVDVYGDITSVPPGVIRSDEEVEAMKQAEMQAAQQAQKMQMIEQGSNAAKNLASADIGGENALTGMLKQVGMA